MTEVQDVTMPALVPTVHVNPSVREYASADAPRTPGPRDKEL